MASEGEVEVELVRGLFDSWDERVRGLPGARLIHRAVWLELWERLYGHEGVGLLARRGDTVVAALPLVRRAHPIFGRHWISMPYLDGAGVAGDPQAGGLLLDAALGLAARRRDSYVEVRELSARPWSWSCTTAKMHVVKELPSSEDALMKGLDSKLRSQVRRAEREQPELVTGGAELAGELHRVYAERMWELGSPPHPASVFAAICQALPAESAIQIVRLAGEAVAGALLLLDGDTVLIPWASTLSRVNKLSINMFVYASALRWSIARGAARFDFGRTDAGSSHARFKLQWGGRAELLHWYRQQPSMRSGLTRGLGGGRDLASRVWRRLPVKLSTAIGPRIVAYF